jgi:enamine deaminase RidA (YjgF/YER057c/UK114 family)
MTLNAFNVFRSGAGLGFEESLNRLLPACRQYQQDIAAEGCRLRYCKIFLSDIVNQWQPLMESALYKEILSRAGCSVIGQPPLDGSKVNILTLHGPGDEALFHSLRLSREEAKGRDSYAQTAQLFEKYLAILREKGLTLEHDCVRTWLYVSDIDNNYAGVVKARNELFMEHGMTPETHFIASTGIGGKSPAAGAVVSMDFLTYPNLDAIRYLHAPDHLSPTHEYGVAFERGTLLSLHGKKICLISGTASIDARGKIVHAGNVYKQAKRLLDNISALLAEGGAKLSQVGHFIVYLRDSADYPVIHAYLSNRFPDTPFVIVHAPICRPGWLVEMECAAEST